MVLFVVDGSTAAPALWLQAAIEGVAVAYVTPICSPVSVLTVEMRRWLYAGQVNEPGTRLGSMSPAKLTAGNVTAVPVPPPVRTIRSSHSDGLVPSAGSGNDSVNAYVSTGLYVPAAFTLVWIWV